MKCLPPGVQVPQHSDAGVFHPGKTGRRSLPSDEICHNEEELVFGSVIVNRRSPLGDQRKFPTRPGATAIICSPLPSLRTRWILDPIAYTTLSPSGLQLASST